MQLTSLGGGGTDAQTPPQTTTTQTTTGTSPTAPTPTRRAGAGRVPAPFESRALYAFARQLFEPSQCAQVEPGEYRVLDQLPDLEAVHCEGETYAVNLFRKTSADELPAERQLYVSHAVVDSVTPISEAPPGLSDGRRFSFAHEFDGYARVYWDSISCPCGGVVVASDGDVPAAIDFWRGR